MTVFINLEYKTLIRSAMQINHNHLGYIPGLADWGYPVDEPARKVTLSTGDPSFSAHHNHLGCWVFQGFCPAANRSYFPKTPIEVNTIGSGCHLQKSQGTSTSRCWAASKECQGGGFSNRAWYLAPFAAPGGWQLPPSPWPYHSAGYAGLFSV